MRAPLILQWRLANIALLFCYFFFPIWHLSIMGGLLFRFRAAVMREIFDSGFVSLCEKILTPDTDTTCWELRDWWRTCDYRKKAKKSYVQNRMENTLFSAKISEILSRLKRKITQQMQNLWANYVERRLRAYGAGIPSGLGFRIGIGFGIGIWRLRLRLSGCVDCTRGWVSQS